MRKSENPVRVLSTAQNIKKAFSKLVLDDPNSTAAICEHRLQNADTPQKALYCTLAALGHFLLMGVYVCLYVDPFDTAFVRHSREIYILSFPLNQPAE